MHTGKGQVVELMLEDGLRHTRISCPTNLIPAPGQYLLASDASDSPLPASIFSTDSTPQGFIAAAPVPDSWIPGRELHLRGPLGRGFNLPGSARKVALVAFDDAPLRLRGLIVPALKSGAAVTLVTNLGSDSLPDEVEVQPVSALAEIAEWADVLAFDVACGNLFKLEEYLGSMKQAWAGKGAQVLVRTPMPCGGIADCGVCAVAFRSGWKMACKDGPVFELMEIF